MGACVHSGTMRVMHHIVAQFAVDCMNCSVLALRRLDACDALFDPCKAGCMHACFQMQLLGKSGLILAVLHRGFRLQHGHISEAGPPTKQTAASLRSCPCQSSPSAIPTNGFTHCGPSCSEPSAGHSQAHSQSWKCQGTRQAEGRPAESGSCQLNHEI